MSKVANGIIVKIDQEKQLVFGWASVIKDTNDKILLDRQEDFIESEDELEKAAYDYVLKSRDGGEMHIRKGVSTMVESVVLSKEKQSALGIPAGIVPIGWWVGFKVNDDRVWNEVKKGGYVGFSVHGTGKRHNEEIAFDKITEVEKCACEPQVVAKYNPQYWSVMRKAQIAIVGRAISKGEAPGHPFRGNQWTRGKGGAGSGGGAGGAGKSKSKKPKMKVKEEETGSGSSEKIYKVKTVSEGVKLILEGKLVEMPNIKGAHTLLTKMAKLAQKGVDFNPCSVSVAGTNAFCGEHKGIDRADMPQAKGEVVKGSKAEKALAKENAKRAEKGEPPKTEYDAKEEFVKSMIRQGIGVGEPKTVRSDKLKATQKNMVGAQVVGMMSDKSKDFGKEPIYVSSDGYVVDGHHRWAAQLGRDMADGKLGNNHRMRVIVLDAPISVVLRAANKFTKDFGIKPKSAGGSGKKKKKK